MKLDSFSSQAHQNVVGMSLQAASTNIAALKAAGTTVRVINRARYQAWTGRFLLAKVLCAHSIVLGSRRYKFRVT